AQAYFAGTMKPAEGHVLKPGQPVLGAPVLTVGPGTGFGQALFVPGANPQVIATEGGHRLIPVRTERELRLCQTLTQDEGHPAILEYALSGRGICRLYDAVLRENGAAPDPCDPPAVTQAALAGPGPAREAIVWFIELLAVAAADACVMTGARGGVAISGGITPRLVPLFDDLEFTGHFARPGILHDYLEQVPVTLVTNPYAALYGAATLMRSHLGIR
ncbi:MAG: glucokinase, partial [Pseudomonadota bacterium]